MEDARNKPLRGTALEAGWKGRDLVEVDDCDGGEWIMNPCEDANPERHFYTEAG